LSVAGILDPKCEDNLRHKAYLLHPDWFRKRGIPLVRIVQRPGDYVVTFPQGYHFGFNVGYNTNEARNYATPRWINWGKVSATKCTCG
jgi:[histone H3]-trimethyl-L-lysine9/36 demethylase